jgi:hypothetical protein
MSSLIYSYYKVYSKYYNSVVYYKCPSAKKPYSIK